MCRPNPKNHQQKCITAADNMKEKSIMKNIRRKHAAKVAGIVKKIQSNIFQLIGLDSKMRFEAVRKGCDDYHAQNKFLSFDVGRKSDTVTFDDAIVMFTGVLFIAQAEAKAKTTADD